MNKRYLFAVIAVLTFTGSLFAQVDSTFFTPHSWTEPETLLEDMYKWDVCDLGEGQLLMVGTKMGNRGLYFYYRIFSDDCWSELDSVYWSGYSGVGIYLFSDSTDKAWLFTAREFTVNAFRFNRGYWESPTVLSGGDFWCYHDVMEGFRGGEKPHIVVANCPDCWSFYKLSPPDSIYAMEIPYSYEELYCPFYPRNFHSFGDTVFFTLDCERDRPIDPDFVNIILGRYYDGSWAEPDIIFSCRNFEPYEFNDGFAHSGDKLYLLIATYETVTSPVSYSLYCREEGDWRMYDIPFEGAQILTLALDRARNHLWIYGNWSGRGFGYTIFHDGRFSPLYYPFESGTKSLYYDLVRLFFDSGGGIRIFNGNPLYSNPLCETRVTTTSIAENNNTELQSHLAVYPNPFNSTSNIDIGENKGIVSIYNLNGAEIRKINIDKKTVWDGKNNRGKDCPSGIYLIRYNNESITLTGKVLLLR